MSINVTMRPRRLSTPATSGGESYGAGRYLLDSVKGADLGTSDGLLVCDFNFAYNPSCAYDPAWACPLAPPGNIVGKVPTGTGIAMLAAHQVEVFGNPSEALRQATAAMQPNVYTFFQGK